METWVPVEICVSTGSHWQTWQLKAGADEETPRKKDVSTWPNYFFALHLKPKESHSSIDKGQENSWWPLKVMQLGRSGIVGSHGPVTGSSFPLSWIWRRQTGRCCYLGQPCFRFHPLTYSRCGRDSPNHRPGREESVPKTLFFSS